MNLLDNFTDLLETYDHAYQYRVVENILRKAKEQKACLYANLSKHPHWDESQQAIILKAEYSRGFDTKKITEFIDWIQEIANQILYKSNVEQIKNALNEKMDALSSALRVLKRLDKNYDYDTNYFIGKIYTDYIETKRKYRLIEDKAFCRKGYFASTLEGKRVSDLEELVSCLHKINSCESQFITETTLDYIKARFPDVHCVIGQKVSKVIGAICHLLKIDKEERYNAKYALFSDGVNPLKYETHTVISINPLDYLTMSFGNSWASCHTIDKENIRPNNGDNHYHGMYCAGTMSYMLDTSTVIFYYVDKEWDEEMWKADKVKRCNFHISEDGAVIIQGRVYPDGRDGGEQGLAQQFRAIVQNIVAECWNIPNYWSNKKGTENCEQYIHTVEGSAHYPDYVHYDDCNVSINKDATPYGMIKVGHRPICLECGSEYENTEYLSCNYCRDEEPEYGWCNRCGEINPEDYIVDEETDNRYCCEECARRSGLQYVSDLDEWTSSDDVYYDPYAEQYYSEYAVCTENERYFYTEDNARNYGYESALNEDGDEVWIHESKCYWSERTQRWYTYDYDLETEEEGA